MVLSVVVGCSGVKDPSTMKEKKISELSAEDVRGVCAFNTQAYRAALPMEDWDTAFCGGLVMLEIMAKDKLMAVHDQKVSREDCAFQLGECGFAPQYEILAPEADCERLDVAKTLTCGATVAELQACIQERTERSKVASKVVRDKSLCDSKQPIAEVDLLSGPACTKLKSDCPGFNLALPGAIRGIR